MLPPRLPQSLGLAPVSPTVTQICPSGTSSASSLGEGTILHYVLHITSSSEASASLGGEVRPCPHHAVTSFPRVFLCGDCSPNQDGDSAHYKLVRQRLCAPSRDRLSGSLANLPLPRTPGQRPLHGASLLGLSAPSPGTQTDRRCLLRPVLLLQKLGRGHTVEGQMSGLPLSRAEQHLAPEVTLTRHVQRTTHEESVPGRPLWSR